MAFVGPLVSLLIGGLCFLLVLPLRSSQSPLEAILGYLAVTNILLGIFNLIPGFPLDGGRVLRSIVWKISGSLRTATRVASMVGQIIAYLFILWGIFQFFGGDILDGIWIGFIGWFLLSAAQSANSQAMLNSMFQGVTVGQVRRMNRSMQEKWPWLEGSRRMRLKLLDTLSDADLAFSPGGQNSTLGVSSSGVVQPVSEMWLSNNILRMGGIRF